MKKYALSVLILLACSCEDGGWTNLEVQNATSSCVDVLNNIPCPNLASDIDGDGNPDTVCGLGSSTNTACECLIRETQHAMSENDFERLLGNENPEDCRAIEVFEDAAQTCLTDIPCPSPNSDINGDGFPDENCGINWQPMASTCI